MLKFPNQQLAILRCQEKYSEETYLTWPIAFSVNKKAYSMSTVTFDNKRRLWQVRGWKEHKEGLAKAWPVQCAKLAYVACYLRIIQNISAFGFLSTDLHKCKRVASKATGIAK